MHRASTSMATACTLCHTGSSRTPVYIATSNGTANNPGIRLVTNTTVDAGGATNPAGYYRLHAPAP